MLPFEPTQLPAALRDPRVLEAMARVPREAFVPEALRSEAHKDVALPLPHGQSISQPLIVAWMSAALGARPGARILEIGTGSGYQTAVLAAMGLEVWTVEVVPELAASARARLAALGLDAHVHFRVGDGRHGWPGQGPFDGILVAAAPLQVPPALLAALAPGGALVIPVGERDRQALHRLRRVGDHITDETLLGVRFVPLVSPAASA